MRIFHKEVPIRRFGVELEVSNTTSKSFIGDCLKAYESSFGKSRDVRVTAGAKGWAESRSNSYWHVKYDSTCGPQGKYSDHGWEIASYVGCGSVDVRQISKAASFLNFNGIECNHNCGLHIHVEIADFSKRDMGIMMSRWLKVEECLFHICKPRRRNNVYCRSLFDRYFSSCLCYPTHPKDLWDALRPSDLSTHGNCDKKYAINTVGYTTGEVVPDYNRKTVELRIPECVLDEDHVRCWAILFLNFVESCVDSPYPEDPNYVSNLTDILFYMGLNCPEGLIFCDPDLWGAKCWFLRKLAGSGLSKISEDAENHLEFISRF